DDAVGRIHVPGEWAASNHGPAGSESALGSMLALIGGATDELFPGGGDEALEAAWVPLGGEGCQSQPASRAILIASIPFRPPTLAIAFDRQVRTVPGESASRPAIASVDRPDSAARRTSASRLVSGVSPVSMAAATSSGSKTRWPRATRRTASARLAPGAS